MKKDITILNNNDWQILLKKAEQGNSKAMNEVAFNYEHGLTADGIVIVEKNTQLAFDWTKKSYETGDLDGMINYANYLSDGKYLFCEKNIQLAMKLYEKAMHLGSSVAAYSLGIEYRNQHNFEKAFELYSKSNKNSGDIPDLTIGLCYYYGIGIEKNKLQALKIFESINLNVNTPYEVDEANYLLGKLYLEGEIVEQSIDKARYYLELADKDGDHNSAQELLFVIGRSPFINNNNNPII